MIGDTHHRAALRADIAALGVQPGDLLMVHASLRSVGAVDGGRTVVIDALVDALGPDGTLVAYSDWEPQGSTAFDRRTSPAAEYLGGFSECVRNRPGAMRSGNPGASIVAIGPRAGWITANHPLDYGYGPGSPLARLVEVGGKIVMLGAPRDTMTLLHHSEHLADVPGKRTVRHHVPFATGARWIEEFDTADPVLDGLAEDYFGTIVTEFLDSGQGITGQIGSAASLLVDAAAVHAFAVGWIERWARDQASG